MLLPFETMRSSTRSSWKSQTLRLNQSSHYPLLYQSSLAAMSSTQTVSLGNAFSASRVLISPLNTNTSPSPTELHNIHNDSSSNQRSLCEHQTLASSHFSFLDALSLLVFPLDDVSVTKSSFCRALSTRPATRRGPIFVVFHIARLLCCSKTSFLLLYRHAVPFARNYRLPASNSRQG